MGNRKKPPGNKSPENAAIEHVALDSIWPSTENNQIYRPVDPSDPEIKELAASIRKNGIMEPLVVTADDFIVSGHRRYAAAKLAGLEDVPIRRLSIFRTDDIDAFVRLLREYNRQREKTNAERLREEIVSINPHAAYAELRRHRREAETISAESIDLGSVKVRSEISDGKQPMLDAAIDVINLRKKFWPLTVRQIHYALLNNPPLRHTKKAQSRYQNDRRSYQDLADLLTRARVAGLIPFDVIDDPTRPVTVWDVHQTVRSFMRREMNTMFKGYARDLMQSQPHHVELVGEKNTVGNILRPVASEYTIPLTLGRGYCSTPPRKKMLDRFKRSGKNTFVILIVSDFDPEGEDIAHNVARSMRDDFGIANVQAVKAALTMDQVKKNNLPPNLEAKAASSRAKKFVAKNGKAVFELEAIPPETLQQIVRRAIENVIDRKLFDREMAAEREDAADLEGVRRKMTEAVKGTDFDSADDE
jgi:ParB/RepB/Spo0J family partition protein